MKFKTGGSEKPKKEVGDIANRGKATAATASPQRADMKTQVEKAKASERRRSSLPEIFLSGGRFSNGAEVDLQGSPRTGRPNRISLLSLGKLDTSKLTLDSDDETGLAFEVPDTPPRRSDLGRPAVGNRSKALPFPSAADEEEVRHVVCQDSLAPWSYLLQIPGKNVRDQLIDAFNQWIRCSEPNLDVIKQVVGYLHTASLIVDDIEDESVTRRGQPAAHIVYGTARALNAGNYVYFLALEKAMTLQSTDCITIFTAEMLNLHRGQGRDIFWRTTSHIASESEYCQMVCDKTGGLFRLAIRLMQALSPYTEGRLQRFSSSKDITENETDSTSAPLKRSISLSAFTAKSDFTSLCDQLACYFQIRDDLINLASPSFHLKKGFCEDITEGKLSFIALHSLRAYKEQGKEDKFKELMEILNSKTEDRKVMKRALTLMDDTNSFDFTIQYLKKLFDDVKELIQSLGSNDKLLHVMSAMAAEVEDCHQVRKRVINAL